MVPPHSLMFHLLCHHSETFPSLRYINPQLTMYFPKLDLFCTLVYCHTNLVLFSLLRPLTPWEPLCHMHDFCYVQLHQLQTNYHKLQSTFTQEAPWSFQSSVHISFYLSALCSLNFILLVLVLLLRFDCTCVRLQTQLWLYFSSVSTSNPNPYIGLHI